MRRVENLMERVRDANPVPDSVEPDWSQVKDLVADAGTRARVNGGPARSPRRSRATNVLAGLAVCVALATAGVLVLEPGGGSPGFLARAAAALTPASGTVLYERWQTTILREAGNPGRSLPVTLGPDELWIQADHPRRYRTILRSRTGSAGSPSSEGGVRLAYDYGVDLSYSGPGVGFHGGKVDLLVRLQRSIQGGPLELGGTVENPVSTTRPGEVRPTLTYLPSNELLRARLRVTLGAILPGPHDQAIEDGADPVAALRAALLEGRAHDAGTTQLAGRTVQRIDLVLPTGPPADAPPLPPDHHETPAPAYALVEPDTFHPVEIVFGGEIYRFLDYRYLPATAANLTLTDMRTQHPGAKILDTTRRG